MFQKLKRKYLTQMVLFAAIFAIIGLVFIVGGIDGVKIAFSKPVPLEDVDLDRISTMKVTATIDYVMDYYSFSTEGSETVGKEYFIPVGEEEYMGLVLSGGNMYQADANMEATWAYLEGDMDAQDDIEPFTITAVIKPLEGESLRFFHEYVDAIENMSESEKEIFLPYALTENESVFTALLPVVFGLAFIAGAVICFVLGIKENNLKAVRKYCEATGNKEMAEQKLEQLWATGAGTKEVKLSNDLLLAVVGTKAFLADTKDIVWVYQHVTKHSVNFIPTGKTYAIKVCLANGRDLLIPMGGKKRADENIELIAGTIPYVLIGYDEQLSKAYIHDRASVIRAVEERRNEFFGQQQFPGAQ